MAVDRKFGECGKGMQEMGVFFTSSLNSVRKKNDGKKHDKD